MTGDRRRIKTDYVAFLHRAASVVIRRATRRQFSAEEKIRIVLSGLRGKDSIAELCVARGSSRTSIIEPALRRIRLRDAESAKTLVFLSNQFALPATTICALYKARWQVELFFKWIKQHLRIKRFYGTSENAVKAQIWIAVSVYVLVAIVKKRLNLDASLYTLLQILSVTLFEKTLICHAVTGTAYKSSDDAQYNQLNLFAF